MTNLDLLSILGGVKNQYILDAQAMRTGRKKRKTFPYVRQIAAILVLLLLLSAFFRTAPGAAALEYVKQQVENLIETLFPPKEMSIYLEGFEVEGSYAADGVEPEMNEDAAKPGFAIYYDVDYYTMEKEGDVTYIRSYNSRKKILDYYGNSLAQLPEEEREAEIERLMNEEPDPRYPPCEIEIVHLELPFDQAAAKDQEELDGQWEVQQTVFEDKVMLNMRNGWQWDSLMEDRTYVSDGQGGCFRIISRYFFEAVEGHGMRFAAMVRTFTVIPPQASTESSAGQNQAETISQSKPVSLEPVTFDGYALNSEGLTDQIRLTMSVENVLEGEAAYQQILSQGTQLPVPEQGKEYILVTVKVTYEDGDLETLNFYENYPASWAAARVHFLIPCENSNSFIQDVTRQLPNCIWGPDEFEGRTLSKGESITGDVAFLLNVGNTAPLCFEGYNQVIKFQIH